MRKAMLTTGFLAFVAIGLSSCDKCELCTKESSNDVRVCSNNYDSNTAYGLALDIYEGQGYTCR
jgi:hypothetical protein